MNDLISRSELLKEIEKYKFCAISNDVEREYIKKTILDFIIGQPTVYSVDKETVKQGGVSDDVCEWKYDDSEYYFESSCDHLHIFMSDGPKENEYKYCPYCGKKIKAVV